MCLWHRLYKLHWFKISRYNYESCLFITVPPHENDLCRLCWVPFGIQTLKVSDGHTYLLQPSIGGCDEEDLIRLEVPKDAINTDVCKELSIRYGILVHGPFVLEEDYELASMVVYIDFNKVHTTQPLMLHLPDWASEGEATSDVFASHKVDGKEEFKFTKIKLSDAVTMGAIPVYGHCSLFTKAIKEKAGKNFYAFSREFRKKCKTTLSVHFTYASQVWCEVSGCTYDIMSTPFIMKYAYVSVCVLYVCMSYTAPYIFFFLTTGM